MFLPKRSYSEEEYGTHHNSEKFSLILTGEGSSLECKFDPPHFFHGVWEVGVKNVVFPRNLINIDEFCKTIRITKFEKENSGITFINLPTGHYNEEDLTKKMNSLFETAVVDIIVQDDDDHMIMSRSIKTRFFCTESVLSACLFTDEKITFSEKLARQLGIQTKDIFDGKRLIPWQDVFNVQHTESEIKTLHPKFELFLEDVEQLVFIKIKNRNPFHCSEPFIQYKYVGNTLTPLLQIANPEESKFDDENEKIVIQYDEKTVYNTIIDNRMTELVVTLCDSSGRLIPFDGKNMLTLEFRPAIL